MFENAFNANHFDDIFVINPLIRIGQRSEMCASTHALAHAVIHACVRTYLI
jgi:hypothetical protein